MNTTVFLAAWLAPMIVAFVVYWRQIRQVTVLRKHDDILFTLCAARDKMAMKAIRGEVEEGSVLFQFFYEEIASRIHRHSELGPCFSHMVRLMFSKTQLKRSPQFAKMLFRQIRHGDYEIKSIAASVAVAHNQMLREAWTIVLLHSIFQRLRLTQEELAGWVSKQKWLSTSMRSIAAMVELTRRASQDASPLPAFS